MVLDYPQFDHLFKIAICLVKHLQEVLFSFEKALQLGAQLLYQPCTDPLNH